MWNIHRQSKCPTHPHNFLDKPECLRVNLLLPDTQTDKHTHTQTHCHLNTNAKQIGSIDIVIREWFCFLLFYRLWLFALFLSSFFFFLLSFTVYVSYQFFGLFRRWMLIVYKFPQWVFALVIVHKWKISNTQLVSCLSASPTWPLTLSEFPLHHKHRKHLLYMFDQMMCACIYSARLNCEHCALHISISRLFPPMGRTFHSQWNKNNSAYECSFTWCSR